MELGSVWMPPRWGSEDVFEGHAFYKDVAPMELGRKAQSGKRKGRWAGAWKKLRVWSAECRVGGAEPGGLEGKAEIGKSEINREGGKRAREPGTKDCGCRRCKC